jgi:uncharacterized protein (DUF608 family)
MNKYLYIIFISLILGACTSNTIMKKPKDLIPKDQMVDLLTDLILANGGDNVKNLNSVRNTNYFPFVFDKYQIDTVQFKESNYYYTSKIDDYDDILEEVNERLNILKKKYEGEIKITDSIERHKKDSIRNKSKLIVKKPRDIE